MLNQLIHQRLTPYQIQSQLKRLGKTEEQIAEMWTEFTLQFTPKADAYFAFMQAIGHYKSTSVDYVVTLKRKQHDHTS